MIIDNQIPLLPEKFTLTDDGLFYDNIRICSRIDILGDTYSLTNKASIPTNNWSKLVSFKDANNNNQKLIIPMELFGRSNGEVIALLLNHGLQINKSSSSNKLIMEYLQNTRIDKKILITPKVGWHQGTNFIFPDVVIPVCENIYYDGDYDNACGFDTKGSLEEWQEEIAKYCQDNKMLIFALSCAFAAPIIPLLSTDSFGFNIVGSSSIGKTTALNIAASVYGNPKYVLTWRATGNALEAVAESRNNCLLCLDELGQVDGKEIGHIAYMLSHGAGKSRLKAAGGLRKKFEWSLLFLSTGEISIPTAIKSASGKVKAGMLMRVIDIHVPHNTKYGLFDNIHDFADAAKLAGYLKDTTSKIYGSPIREFISKLASKPNCNNIIEEIKKLEADFIAINVPSKATGQITRVAKNFAIVAASGELAIKVGILPFEIGDANKAVADCFNLWLSDRSSIDSYEVDEAIEQVKTFFAQNYSTRFPTIGIGNHLNNPEEKTYNQAGFKKKVGEDGYEFFVLPQVFKEEICTGFDYKATLQALCERGYLIRGNEKQFVKNCRLPTGVNKMYHFTSKILSDEGEE